MNRHLTLINEPLVPDCDGPEGDGWDIAVNLLYDCARAVDAGDLPPTALDLVRDVLDRRLGAGGPVAAAGPAVGGN